MILTVNSRPTTTTADRSPWLNKAACAEVEPEVFFHSVGANPFGLAFAICRDCPVRGECLDAAMSAEAGVDVRRRFGMFGGMTPGDRMRLERTA